jgi:hypothetical protein
MRYTRGLLSIAVGLFCLLVFSPMSVQADSFHELHLVAGFNASGHRDMSNAIKYFEQVTCRSDHTLNLALEKSDDDVLNLPGMTPSNGRSIGLSISASRRGPSIGLVRPDSNTVVSQNPEPAALLLFGTGITAFAALARRRIRRRRQQRIPAEATVLSE